MYDPYRFWIMKKEIPSLFTHWKYYGKILSGLLIGYSFWFCMLILLLRWVNPPFTSFTLQEDWEALGKEAYNLREQWVSADELPDHLKLAVIASEDQRFHNHWGVDMAAIEQAMEDNARGRRLRGASTITQQVAKNLFLSSSQTYFRKGIEAGIAVLIDFFWSKERILEVYLNIAEFGPAMYGIAPATAYYYGTDPANLTPRQSARLATVLPSPKRIEPEPASKYVVQRSSWILRNMQQLSGVRYLPKPESKVQDTIPLPDINFDSLQFPTQRDTIGEYLDSILMELEANTDTLPLH